MTSSSVAALAAFVYRHDRFVVATHISPDGDGIGAQVALVRLLRSLGKGAFGLNAHRTPARYRFLDPEVSIVTLEECADGPGDLDGRALIVVDTNDVHRLGSVANLLLTKAREYAVVDHHAAGGSLGSESDLVDDEASSTCELLCRLFAFMAIDTDLPTATALYAGIVSDTGSFVYAKTTAATLGVAYELLKKGVNPTAIYGRIYESYSVAALRLQSHVHGSLELYFSNRVAVLYVRPDMIRQSGANDEEGDEAVNFPLRSERVRVAVFFREMADGAVKCSLRSKGGVPVSEIAQANGGGGHRTAAGFSSLLPLEQVKSNVLDMLKVYFD